MAAEARSAFFFAEENALWQCSAHLDKSPSTSTASTHCLPLDTKSAAPAQDQQNEKRLDGRYKQDTTRQDTTRYDTTKQGKARRKTIAGKTRQDETRQITNHSDTAMT
jgi:hypothetical protein